MAYEKFRKLMYKISKAYYDEGLTQLEIGEKFGLSRMKVGRLIKEAQKQKIVEIILHEPKNEKYIELEREIEKKYKIDEAIVIDSFGLTYEETLKRIGKATSDYLERVVSGNEVIGLAWGYTVLSVVESLPKKDFPEMKIVQLMGGLGSPELEVYGTNLIVRAAQSFGAKEYILSSPGILPTVDISEALKKDPQIKTTLKLAEKSDIAIIGLGSPRMTLPAVSASILSRDELNKLIDRGAVGDICLHFVDSVGNPLNEEIDKRVVTISLEKLKAIPKVIGVAGGERKYEIVNAALLGNYLNVLITDSNLGNILA